MHSHDIINRYIMKKGGNSGASQNFFNLITGLIGIFVSLFEKLIGFIQENNKTVLYHFIFFLSYIVCFTTLFNTDRKSTRLNSSH